MIYRDMKNIFSFLMYKLSECKSMHMTNEKYNALPVDHLFSLVFNRISFTLKEMPTTFVHLKMTRKLPDIT